jgi:ribosomal protein S18 acetylase RimI-like enzyme
MDWELDRVRRFLAAEDDRFASRRVSLEFGTALFDDALPRVWDLNFVRVERDADLELVLAETDRVQGEAGLEHRKIKTPFEPDLAAPGWKVTCLVAMVHREGGLAGTDGRVEEVDAEALRPKWEADDRDDETVRQLVAARFLRGSRIGARYFAARADVRLVSECTLFFDGETAEVDSVETLEPYRGRGLAKAVVSRAVAEARQARHDLVFLLADEDDWPKELYRRLGFEEIGRVWELLREPQP